ncbi:coiled-coil domain-containing protein 92 [Corythoichthys intestinalis]|uniref:coiled-coil domain-containing protein 92 n=1 Tax=Corythoichthys intestinalis TaxID=161448 RepID=UPI0025A4FEF3|nr:coiled-coil domain-containing protein 92 [Corythoichthys intestinalis]XP_057695497.1 coiled-coil domain-containing protein 92 [Corythoichthys intestinalis]XP_057695498.1 coiled-coil domain-containing protein 92 [Corythoichthys intestinalis]XP_061797124.1 coiled-coil domain-containing 92B-like [Nerophis lumbriciformis]
MGEEYNVARQLESVERSVVFLRQEHLTLLHGLHLEIVSLQRRCSELTNDLKVKPSCRSQVEIQEEEDLLEVRCRDIEDRLSEQEYTIGEIRKELSHKGALVGALRANLKEKERHFLEELKRRSHCSTVLNTELQKQTEVAAYLSFQLHAAKQKLHHQRLQQRHTLLTRGSGQGLQFGSEHNSPQQLLAGPASPSPVVKPKRKSTRTSSRMERARECVPMEKVTGPAEPAAMPDPALFLHPWRFRVRSRQTQRPAPLGVEREDENEGVTQQVPVVAQEDANILVSATGAPPAAGAPAD